LAVSVGGLVMMCGIGIFPDGGIDTGGAFVRVRAATPRLTKTDLNLRQPLLRQDSPLNRLHRTTTHIDPAATTRQLGHTGSRAQCSVVCETRSLARLGRHPF